MNVYEFIEGQMDGEIYVAFFFKGGPCLEHASDFYQL